MTDAGGNSWFPSPIAYDQREREFVSGRPAGRTHWQAALSRPCGMVRPVTQISAKMQYECMTTCTMHRLSLIHISEPTRRTPISYAVFCLKKKKKKNNKTVQ